MPSWKTFGSPGRGRRNRNFPWLFFSFGACPFSATLHAQSGSDAAAEFKKISQGLSAARLGGAGEDAAQMEKALAYLDSLAVSALNVPAEPNLDGANRGLAELASHTPPVGET